ncbi:protein rolling stone-like [Styela clava]
MACKSMKEEFSFKKMGFSCNDKEKRSFYVSQWGQNRAVFFIYRLMIALLSLSWTISFYVYWSIHCKRHVANAYRYITLWSDFLRTTYFTSAFVLCLVGLANDKRNIAEQDFVKWLRGMAWYLHTVSVLSNFAVTTFYWTFVAPTMPDEEAFGIFSILLHACNSVLIILDLVIVAFPVRLLHSIYGMALALFYGVFTILLWRVGDTSAVYEILDWEVNPGVAAALILLSAFVGSPLAQLLTFGIYILKNKVRKHIHKYSSTDETNSMIEIKTEEEQA